MSERKTNITVTVAMAINRTPCPACADELVTAIGAAQGDPLVKKYVHFVLAPTGVYEPTESLTPEQIEKEQAEHQELAQRWGTPVYRIISKLRLTAGTTRWSDLKGPVSAGWDLRQLEAREKPTLSGIVLGEAAHKLAEEFNQANRVGG